MNLKEKTWLIPGAILIGSLIVAAALFLTLGRAASQIALVDVDQIAQKCALSEQINKELQNKQTEIKGKIQLAKDNTEKQQLQVEFEKFRLEKQKQFVSQVKAAVSKVAKAKGIKAVSTTQVFLYNETDLTDMVIKELDK